MTALYTGIKGRSSLRQVELQTGRILLIATLDSNYFGEGITLLGNRIFQLTWQNNRALIYDYKTFKLLFQINYPTEGWGLTTDGVNLIMSDGTDVIRFLDPENFSEIRKISVTDRSVPLFRLNELEYIKGEIYANVWQTNRIARISPLTGKVIRWIDLSGLSGKDLSTEKEAVLNGIAYDQDNDRLFVTGKLWSRIFEIKIVK